jgi:hypothetical protein
MISCYLPLIMVMESPNFWHGDHLPVLWRLDRSRLWTVHRQRQMGSPAVIIRKVTRQEALQMPLVQNDYMIEDLTTDAPDEALHIRILPW